MERQEAVECFTREAEPVLEEGKKLFYRELQEKTEQLSAVICDAIHEIRLETVRLEKEKMMFLHFSLLRAGLEKGEYQILAQAMDARWYLDTEPAEVGFSLDFLFPMWADIRRELMENSRKYRGKVNRYDVQNLVASAVMDCNLMLAQVLRFIFRDVEENPDFAEIEKSDTWAVYWGEYRDHTELVAHVNREKKEQIDWDRALRQTKNEETGMVFGYWYQADLKNSDCKGKLLYFIVFEDCTLENMCFDDAVLTGARFLGCRIKNCSFRNAVIHQADFSGCIWEENDFEGADMLHSVFAEEELPFIHLKPEQLQLILVDRGRQE